jgi:tape measure domain-containing protein
MSDDIKIVVSSDSTAARSDITRLSQSVDKIATSADKAANSSARIGKEGAASLREMSAPLKETSDGLQKVTKLAIGFVGAIALGTSLTGYYQIADSLTLVNNKLKLVTKSSGDMLQVQRKLLDISTYTNTQLEDTADLFYKISRAVKDTGRNNDAILGITKTIQQTILLSGAGAESARGAIVQLAQALSSGTLRGDELNSVMEQLPRLGEALTKELGVSAGKLRDLAAQGQVTTELVLQAITKQSGAIEKEFGGATRTAAMGLNALTLQVRNLVGEIDSLDHASTRMGTYLGKAASYLSEFTPRIKSEIFLFKHSISQYIYELNSFSTVALTAKKVLSTLSFAQIFNIYSSYENSKKALETVTELLQKIGLVKREESTFSKLSSSITSNLPAFSFPKLEWPEPPRSYVDILKESFSLVVSVGYAFVSLFSKFKTVVPNILLPVQEITSQLKRGFTYYTTIISSWYMQQATLFSRQVEGVYQYISGNILKVGADNAIERATSRLFRSNSIVELTSNFNDLGDALNSIRGGNLDIFSNDAIQASNYWMENLKTIGIYLNLIDNRVLFINNIRFDRIINAFSILGSTIARVYQDNFRYPISKLVASVAQSAGAVTDAILDAIIDNLTTGRAEKLGKVMISSIMTTFKSLAVALRGITFKESVFDKIFSLGDAPDKFMKALAQIYTFIKVFLLEIGREVRDSLPRAMRDMADKVIEEAGRLYNIAGGIVTKFTRMVSRAFFDTYDRVVGHSYWPDLIDGVINDSSRLKTALKKVESFADAVKQKFAGIKVKVFDFFQGGGVEKFKLAIDFDAFGNNIYRVVAAAFTAAVLYAFGGIWGKVLAVSSVADILENSIVFPLMNMLKDSIGVFIPAELAKALGTGVGIFIKGLIQNIVFYVGVLVQSVPAFVEALLDEFGLIGKGLKALVKFVTFNNTGLLYTMLFGFVGFKLVTGKLGDVFGLVKTIGSYAASLGTALLPDFLGKAVAPKASVIRAAARKNKKNGKDDKKDNFFGTKLFGAEANPTLLIAGIAALTTSVFESVSMVESLIAAVPLLSWAFLGKDGGSKLIATMRKGGWKVATAVFGAVKDTFAGIGLVRDLIDPLISGGRSVYAAAGAKIAKGIYSPIKSAITEVADLGSKVFSNISKNKMAYAVNGMTLGELFFGRRGSANFVDIPKKYQNVFDSIKKGATDVKSGWATIQSSLLLPGSALSNVRNYISGVSQSISGWKNSVKSGISATFAPLLAEVARFSPAILSKFKSGFGDIKSAAVGFGNSIKAFAANLAGSSGVIGMLLTGAGGKIAIIALLAGILTLFATTANAASTSAGKTVDNLSTMNQVLSIIKYSLMGIVGVLVSIPILSFAFTAFTSGWQAGMAAALRDSKLLYSGMTLVGGAIVNTTGLVWRLSTALYSIGIAPIFTKGFWIGLVLAVEKFGAAIWGLVVAIGSGLATAMSGLWLTMTSISTLIGALIRGVWWFVTTFVAGLLNIGRILLAAASAMATLGAAVIAVVTLGVGLLAVALFGKGNTFFEKLDYAKNAIVSLFTGDAVNHPRAQALSDLVDNTTLDGKRYEVRSKINSIDYSKMSDTEYNNLLKVATAVQDSVKRYNEVLDSAGSVDKETRHQVDAAFNEFDRLANRAAKLDVATSVEKSFTQITKLLDDNTVSWSNQFYNFFDTIWGDAPAKAIQRARDLSAAIGAKVDIIGSVWNDFVARFTSSQTKLPDQTDGIFKRIGDKITTAFKPISDYFDELHRQGAQIQADQRRQAAEADARMSDNINLFSNWFKEATGNTGFNPNSGESNTIKQQAYKMAGVSSFLTDDEKKNILELSAAYAKALDDVGRTKAPMMFINDNEELRKLKRIKDRAKAAFEEIVPQKIAEGEFRASVAGYKDYMEKLSKILAVGLGKGIPVDEMIFGPDFNAQLVGLNTKFEENIKVLRDSANKDEVAIPIKIEQMGLRQQMNDMVDWVHGNALFDAGIELKIKVSGTDVSKEEILKFYQTNQEGFQEWSGITSEIASRTREYMAMSTDFTNPEVITAAMKNIQDLKTKANRMLEDKGVGKGGLFNQLNDLLSKSGGSSITADQFKYFNSGIDIAVVKLRDAVHAKEDFDRNPPKTPDAFIAGWRIVNQQLADANKNLNDIAKSTSERLGEIFGPAGGAADKIRRLPVSKQEQLKNMAPAIEALQNVLKAPDTGLSETAARAVQLKLDDIYKQFRTSKLFEDPKDSIFDRFAEIAQQGGVDITLEKWIQLSDEAKVKVHDFMTSAASSMTKLAGQGGNFPKSAFAKKLADAVQAARDGIALELAKIPVGVMESITGAIDGTAIKMEDFFLLDNTTVMQLSKINTELEDIVNKKKLLKAKGDLGPADLATFRDLNRQELVKREEKKALADLSLPAYRQMTGFADKLGLSLTDKDLIRITADQMQRLVTIGNNLAGSEREFALSGQTQDDWVKLLKARIAAQLEAAAVTKTDIAARLEAIQVSGVDSSKVMMDIALRREFTDVLKDATGQFKEFQELQRKANDGTASEGELEQLKAMVKLREKLGIIASRADSMTPITNMKDLAEALKIDLTDLTNIAPRVLLDLKTNRENITKLFNELQTLGVDEVGRAAILSQRIQERLRFEEQVTAQIAERKQLQDTFKQEFSDGIMSLFKGEGTGGLLSALATTIQGTVIKGFSDKLFTGLSTNMAKILTPDGGMGGQLFNGIKGMFSSGGMLSSVGDLFSSGGALSSVGDLFSSIFGGTPTFDGSSERNAMWVQFARQGVGNLEGLLTPATDTSGITGAANELSNSFQTAGDSLGGTLDVLGKNITKMFSTIMGNVVGPGFNWVGTILQAGQMLLGSGGGTDNGAGGVTNRGGVGNMSGFDTPFPPMPGFDTGGIVPGGIGKPMVVLAHGGETILPTHKKNANAFGSTVINLQIVGDVSRQTKSAIFEMLPQIALGVNAHNREKGNK